MTFLQKLFGSSSADKQPRTAREAFAFARETFENRTTTAAASGRLCCIYTSLEEAQTEIRADGRCRGWHFDFWLPVSQSFYMLRITDGKARGWERKSGRHPVEYIYAVYGDGDKSGLAKEPDPLPENWVDTTVAAATAQDIFQRHMVDIDPADRADYGIMALVYPAACLRYLHPEWTPRLLSRSAPDMPCWAVLMSHIDVDCHDSLLIYVNAVSGAAAGQERFRFPPYMTMGVSADW
jgi:hypothetical protein